MVTARTGLRLSAAGAVMLLLVGSAACSNQGQPTPTATPVSTTAPTAGSSSVAPGPTTAAPAPTNKTSSTLPPPATTPVPPPKPGTTQQTVPPKAEVTKKAVKLDKPSQAGGGVAVRITRVKAIQAKAQLPGEVAGPAVALTLTVKNGSSKTLDLSSVVVTLLDSVQDPGIEMSAKPAEPLSGKLTSGKSTTGVYVFTVGSTRRNPISVSVTLGGAAPVLLFKGDAK